MVPLAQLEQEEVLGSDHVHDTKGVIVQGVPGTGGGPSTCGAVGYQQKPVRPCGAADLGGVVDGQSPGPIRRAGALVQVHGYIADRVALTV